MSDDGRARAISRADAFLQVWNATRDKPFRYLGVTGGNHIVKTYSGRYYTADLVTGTTRRCVALPQTRTHTLVLVVHDSDE